MTKNYKPFLQKAFRLVVHDVLTDVAKNGLDGESHYFITFQTNRSDVIIPDFVRARYPEEMSIILQNQFSDLTVQDNAFSVALTFGGINATLVIPFDAIKIFADPAAQFALSFEPETPVAKPEKSADIVDLTSLRQKK